MDYEKEYHRIMVLLRNTKMEHGLCKPIERNACTKCAAEREIEEKIMAYKGPKIVLS